MSDEDFDRCAERYEELRPIDESWWELYAALVRLGALRGVRVLEIGCGPGRLSQALAERERCRVLAVDSSERMVALARGLDVNARVARAEQLPFKPGWFDAVVMRMVAHLLDRPRAFAEADRVLGPDGRLVIATEDPASFDEIWFARYFPSVPALERSRFPDADLLGTELAAAGFPRFQIERIRQGRSVSRAHALDVIASRAYSTFDLLPPEEYAAGLARAERELPDPVVYEFDWLLAVGSR